MSQVSDYTLSNIGFSAFRTELNSILNASNTLNAGTSAPGSVAAGSLWLDTTNATTPTLKFYDGSDQISLCTFNYSANSVNWLDNTVTADLSGDSTPQLGGMLDVNGNSIGDGTLELLKFSETGSAVNEFTIANAAAGAGPTLSASGTETNVDINITPKGTGDVVLAGDTVSVGDSGAAARTTSPVPLGVILISTLVSVPDADKVGPAPAAALAIVNSLTALPVSENFKSSKVPSPIEFPLTSNIPPNCGVLSPDKSAVTVLSNQLTEFAE
jgi:hypothetical protein